MQWTTEQFLAETLGMGRRKGRRADNMMIKVFIVQLVGVELWELRRQRSVSVSEVKRDYFASLPHQKILIYL